MEQCRVTQDLNRFLNEQELLEAQAEEQERERIQRMNDRVDDVMTGDNEEDQLLCLDAFAEHESAKTLLKTITTVDVRDLPFSAISDAQVKQLARAAYRINKLIEAELPEYLEGKL
jgi:hypothetical protein